MIETKNVHGPASHYFIKSPCSAMLEYLNGEMQHHSLRKEERKYLTKMVGALKKMSGSKNHSFSG